MMTTDLQAPALPAEWYFTGEPFQLEKRTVFAREWQLLARTDTLANSGDFVTANLGGWPLLAMRDESGNINVVRNVCRHQAMQVMEKPKGNCAEIRCRYHGWTYNLQGCLKEAPAMYRPDNIESLDTRLVGINAGQWRGFVFSNIDRQAPPLAATLQALDARLQATDAVFTTELTTDFNGNWKTLLEHFFASRTDAWQWQWPVLGVESLDWGLIIQQMIPRTFSRTRVIEHVFAARGADADCVAAGLEALKGRSAADKAAVAQLQEQREAGQVPAGSGRAAELYNRVRAAQELPPVDDTVAVFG